MLLALVTFYKFQFQANDLTRLLKGSESPDQQKPATGVVTQVGGNYLLFTNVTNIYLFNNILNTFLSAVKSASINMYVRTNAVNTFSYFY